MPPISIGLVGLGKIARDQHLPAIQANPGYRLVAGADPQGGVEGLAHYPSLEAMLSAEPDLDAVAICTPTRLRYAQARQALEAGKHVLLEKPPGATLSEVEALVELAEGCPGTLFAAWHSQQAGGVEAAREWLAAREIRAVEIEWKEDVRVWHPGQAWLWEPGGMGVFDPGINALSVATRVLPRPFFLRQATLDVPANCQTPIAAELAFMDADETPIAAAFDFRQTGEVTWEVRIETDAGRLRLSHGGNRLLIDDDVVVDAPAGEGGDEPARLAAMVGQEYAGLYARFAELAAAGRSEVDVAPLRQVADAFLYGRRESVEPFEP
ncbi:Gfo/Idh/MocA family protein [Halomonas organivorans]|uniref:Putative dehydrogenase n=1 Tax=Halomonas organivorans TaxID=257772 RepID=A0A7W5C2I8_9GAMM|nr:Gfo/Idh/MocA family oxidoreductase [Halomonas organivorans]MBB3143550.1 putative dehydrogenase [Halomonas organivorans]